MLKQLSFILILSPLLVACGGGGGVDKIVVPPKSSSSSSAPASSSSSESSSSSSESSSSSSSAATVINVDMATGWRGNSGGEVGLSNEGVTMTASADGAGVVFDLLAPVNLKNAVVDFVINVSTEYAASGSNIQPFAQVKTDGYPGEYDCWVNNVDLTAGVDQTISCTIDEDEFDQTANDIQIGLQAKGTMLSGTVLIKSVTITLASGQVVSSSSSSSSSSETGVYTFSDAGSLTSWTVNGGGSPDLLTLEFNSAGGINIVPVDWSQLAATNYKYESRFALPAPVDIVAGTKISFTVSVPQSYITDATAVLQINWGDGTVHKYGGAGGGYRTLSAAGGVSSTEDFVISETVTEANVLSGTTILALQLSAAPTDTNIKDKILIKSVKVE